MDAGGLAEPGDEAQTLLFWKKKLMMMMMIVMMIFFFFFFFAFPSYISGVHHLWVRFLRM